MSYGTDEIGKIPVLNIYDHPCHQGGCYNLPYPSTLGSITLNRSNHVSISVWFLRHLHMQK